MHAAEGMGESAEKVATSTWVSSSAAMPAFSSAFCEAPKHRSTQVSPFSATRRSRMPVRVTIHSSLVSTMRSRSALVSRVSGTQWPIPRMMQEVFIGTLVWWVWTGGAGRVGAARP